MPPLPAVSDVLKVSLSGQAGDGEFSIIQHFQYAGFTPTTADLDTLASDIISTIWPGNISPLQKNIVVLKQVVIEDLTSTTSAVGSAGGSAAGSITTANDAPASTCILEKDLISRRYRGGHPRHYWPFCDGNQLATATSISSGDAAAWTSGIQAYVAAVNAEIVALGSTLSNYVSVSYFSGHVLRTVPLVDIITGIFVETKLATQRRRLMR